MCEEVGSANGKGCNFHVWPLYRKIISQPSHTSLICESNLEVWHWPTKEDEKCWKENGHYVRIKPQEEITIACKYNQYQKIIDHI